MILTNPQMFSSFLSLISRIFYKEKGKKKRERERERERTDEMLVKVKNIKRTN